MKKTKFLLIALITLTVLVCFSACTPNSKGNGISNESHPDTVIPEESDISNEPDSDTVIPGESETDSTVTPPQTEIDPEIYQHLEFHSNGDGTCSLISIGNYETEHLAIPAISPDGDKVTTIGSGAGGCSLNYKTVTIPDGVEIIRDAFFGCEALEVIYIPKTVKSVKGSFQNSTNIREVHITDMAAWMNIDFTSDFGNPLYHSEAVLYLNGNPVIDLVVPDSVMSIGDYAFAGYDHIQSVTATDNSDLMHIGEKAFYRCPKLMSAVLSAKLSTIDEEAFNNCPRLVEVVNPSKLEIVKGNSNGYIGYNAIKVETDPDAPSRLVYKDDFVFYNDGENGKIYLVACLKDANEIVLPSDFNGGEYYINKYCLIPATVEKLVIGKGVKGIKDYGLANMSIKEIVFESGSVLQYIGNFSFSYCGIESIQLPAETVVIGAGAFENCRELASVTFEENSKLELIGSTAFGNCSNLETITIPKSVKCIGEQVCRGYRIKNITFEDPTGWSIGTYFDPVPEQSLSNPGTAATMIRQGKMLFKGTQEEYMEFIAQDNLQFN